MQMDETGVFHGDPDKLKYPLEASGNLVGFNIYRLAKSRGIMPNYPSPVNQDK